MNQVNGDNESLIVSSFCTMSTLDYDHSDSIFVVWFFSSVRLNEALFLMILKGFSVL